MFFRMLYIILFAILTVVFLTGCSGNPTTAVTPEETGKDAGPARLKHIDSEHGLWGVWRLAFEEGQVALKAIPVRDIEAHFNITSMLTPPVCADCLVIKVLEYNPPQHTIKLKATLANHTSIAAYDVRGIVVSNVPEIRVTNADSYTDQWDDGGDVTINPFKAFATDQLNRKFSAYSSHSRVYEMRYPSFGELLDTLFIVDVSWPGNCEEPYEISGFQQEGPISTGGGSSQVRLIVSDWQYDAAGVFIDATPIGGTLAELTHSDGFEWFGQLDIAQENQPGFYELLAYGGTSSGPQKLYNYINVEIVSCLPDGNDGWLSALSLPVGESIAGQTVCPLDKEDWFTFTVTDHVYGEIRLALEDAFGKADLTLYSNPTAPHLKWVEGEYGADAVVDVTPLDLGGGTYYIRVRHIGNDTDARTYTLSNNTKDSACYPEGNDSYLNAISLPIGSNSGEQYVCLDDKEDWFSVIYDGTSEYGLELLVTNATGKADLTLYSETQAPIPSGPHILWVEANPNAKIKLNTLGLDAGTYFMRVRHIGNDADFRQYVLSYTSVLPGFVKTWGGVGARVGCTSNGFDQLGNSFVAGHFYGTVDFDPGAAVVERASNDYSYGNGFVSKFDNTGEFEWVATFAGGGNQLIAMSVTGSGQVLLCGDLHGTVDFDPGPGVENRTAPGYSSNAYLCKLNQDGLFQWVRTWGDEEIVQAWDLDIDGSGNILVTGPFSGTVDFNTGDGFAFRSAVGQKDIFLTKFNDAGEYQWVSILGDENHESISLVTADVSGNSYVVYNFYESPQPYDIVINKFSPDGVSGWELKWEGGYNPPSLTDIFISCEGRLFFTGAHRGMDFDPGPAIYIPDLVGDYDAFLIELDVDGNYYGGISFGGTAYDTCTCGESGPAGDIVLGGIFDDDMDLDPGSGEILAELGWNERGMFFIKLDKEMEYMWGDHLIFELGGGSTYLSALSITNDGYNIFSGVYKSTLADFDPGPGTNWHGAIGDPDGFLVKLNSEGGLE